MRKDEGKVSSVRAHLLLGVAQLTPLGDNLLAVPLKTSELSRTVKRADWKGKVQDVSTRTTKKCGSRK